METIISGTCVSMFFIEKEAVSVSLNLKNAVQLCFDKMAGKINLTFEGQPQKLEVIISAFLGPV